MSGTTGSSDWTAGVLKTVDVIPLHAQVTGSRMLRHSQQQKQEEVPVEVLAVEVRVPPCEDLMLPPDAPPFCFQLTVPAGFPGPSCVPGVRLLRNDEHALALLTSAVLAEGGASLTLPSSLASGSSISISQEYVELTFPWLNTAK